MIAAGRIEQGIGIGIMGGLLGIVLATSSVMYWTTVRETLGRGLLLFLQWTAERNIPGGGRLVPLDDRDIPSRQGRSADPELLGKRMELFAIIGLALAAAPTIVVAALMSSSGRATDPIVKRILDGVVIGILFLATVGGVGGMAVGALTVPGVHRRNIILGTIAGIAVGAGMGVAIVPAAKIPAWQMYCCSCGVFGWLGLASGLASGDSVRKVFHDADETDHGRDD